MNPRLPLLAALLAAPIAAPSLVGQSFLTVPNSATTTDGNTSDPIPWESSDARSMTAYAASEFLTVGTPVEITRILWRADGGLAGAGGSFATVRVDLSSSANPFNSLSTTFDANHGADRTTVYLGSASVEPLLGTTPNDFIVDLTLTTPFTYDPALGADLLVDVIVSLHSGDPNGRVSDCVSGSGTGMRVWANTRSAFDGTIDDKVPVMTFEYNGGFAGVGSFGTGCGGGGAGATYYEEFGAGNPFDLTAGPLGDWRGIPTVPSYFVIPSGTGVAASAGVINFTDDQTQAVALPWSMPYMNGLSTTDIWINANGWIAFESTTDETALGTVEELISGPARIAPLWLDLNPSAGGTIQAAQDATDPTLFRVTFTAVPEFPNVGANTFQVTFHQDGTIDVNYGAVSATNALVGFSPGNGAGDRGGRDITADLPVGWLPGADTDDITLSTVGGARPVAGTQIDFEVDQIPFSAFGAAVMLSFQQVQPGLDLSLIGATGCEFYLGPVLSNLVVPINGTATSTVSFNVPNGAFWLGRRLYAQAAVAGALEVQPLPVATSNGLNLLVDQM